MRDRWFWPMFSSNCNDIFCELKTVAIMAHNHYMLARYSCDTQYDDRSLANWNNPPTW